MTVMVVVYAKDHSDNIVGVFDDAQLMEAAIAKDIDQQGTDKNDYDRQIWTVNELDGHV